MSSLKIAVLCVLVAYLLVVAFNFVTKLRSARLAQKLLCVLFPLSQICLLAYPLACSARYELPPAAYASLIALGFACGPVDLLLFRALFGDGGQGILAGQVDAALLVDVGYHNDDGPCR